MRRSRLLIRVVGGFAVTAVVLMVPLTRDASSAGARRALAEIGAQALRGHLLFTRTHANDVQTLFLATRTRVKRVTRPGAYCCLLRISPDHKKILVMPGGDIRPPVTGGTINLEGRGFKRLPTVDRTLNLIPQAWSPDGRRIAFEGWDDSRPSRTGVYTAKAADGAGLVRVTRRPGRHHDIPLDYSPDGMRLVLYRSVGVDPDPYIGGSLWVVRADGSGLHRVAGRSVHPAPWARWSKDGRRILFGNERKSRSGALWTVRPDGTHLTKLFADRRARFPIQPVWSPDGKQILFALDPNNDQFTHPDNSLDLIDSHGGHLQRVLGGNNFKSQPEWWR